MITFTVPAVPVAMPRPRVGMRFVKGGGKVAGIMRDDKHPVHAFKAAVQMAARQAYQGAPIESPLFFQAIFVMPRPRKFNRKKDDPGRLWCPTNKDLDNLAKSTCDAMNGLTYRDDALIVRMVLSKVYAARDEQPCVEITIEAI